MSIGAKRFLYTDPFEIGGLSFTAAEILAIFAPMLGDARQARIAEVIAQRTYTVVPVLEGLYDRGNQSAVLRSAEALGFQAVHIVESTERFKKANRVTQGAEKWLDITTWDRTLTCVQHLRGLGYRILATHFEDATPIDDVDFTTPSAVFFGNEKDGVSEELIASADERIVIPMDGFSRSFNISVAAALCLYHVRAARRVALGKHGDLDEEERRILSAAYCLRSVPHAERILREHRRREENTPS